MSTANWFTPPQPKPDQPVMVEVFCSGDSCRQSVGHVGLPPVRGASMLSVEFKCGHCGRTTWWRSA